MLRAVRGHRGGYRLEKAPSAYTALEILAVTEGSLAPVACLEGEENTCPNRDVCQTLPVWERLDALIGDYLNSISLQDLLNDDHQAHETCPLTQGRRS